MWDQRNTVFVQTILAAMANDDHAPVWTWRASELRFSKFGADLEIAVLVKLFTTPKDNSIKPTSPDIVAFDGNFSFDL